jgi:hypothetical protein
MLFYARRAFQLARQLKLRMPITSLKAKRLQP